MIYIYAHTSIHIHITCICIRYYDPMICIHCIHDEPRKCEDSRLSAPRLCKKCEESGHYEQLPKPPAVSIPEAPLRRRLRNGKPLKNLRMIGKSCQES